MTAAEAAADVLAAIETVEGDAALLVEAGFRRRAETIDALELEVIDRIDGLLAPGTPPAGLRALRRRAERAKRRLERVDERLFRRLRGEIRSGGLRGAALRARLLEHAGGGGEGGVGYDALDVLVNGVLLAHPLPAATLPREPEMVFHQRTPARMILEMVERARLSPADVFYDIGAGLGQVAILAHLLSGAAARGVEYEPAYCDYARACAAELRLPGVGFVRSDARVADYTGGTVFFLYTPFRGAMLREVLALLRTVARTRPIRLLSYGPCTAEVAEERWLQRAAGDGALQPDRLAAFHGR